MEFIIRSFELRGHRVSLSRDTDGLFCVVVHQRGQARRIATRDASLVVAGERFDQCVLAVQAISGVKAA